MRVQAEQMQIVHALLQSIERLPQILVVPEGEIVEVTLDPSLDVVRKAMDAVLALGVSPTTQKLVGVPPTGQGNFIFARSLVPNSTCRSESCSARAAYRTEYIVRCGADAPTKRAAA